MSPSFMFRTLKVRARSNASRYVRAVHFMNGGVYPDLHRPQPVQEALLDPEQGRCAWPPLEAPERVAAALLGRQP
jgi:hypothetical protein